MVVIGISHNPSTDEYRVFWKDNNVDDEGKAYYTNSPDDAVMTLVNIVGQSASPDVRMSNDTITLKLVAEYFGRD